MSGHLLFNFLISLFSFLSLLFGALFLLSGCKLGLSQFFFRSFNLALIGKFNFFLHLLHLILCVGVQGRQLICEVGEGVACHSFVVFFKHPLRTGLATGFNFNVSVQATGNINNFVSWFLLISLFGLRIFFKTLW